MAEESSAADDQESREFAEAALKASADHWREDDERPAAKRQEYSSSRPYCTCLASYVPGKFVKDDRCEVHGAKA